MSQENTCGSCGYSFYLQDSNTDAQCHRCTPSSSFKP